MDNNQYEYGNQPLNQNVYSQYTPNKPKRRWIMWVIIGVALTVIVSVIVLVAVIKPLLASYNISNRDVIEEAAEDVLDIELEKMDKDLAKESFGKDVEKVYTGLEYSEDTSITLMWMQFEDADEALEIFKEQAEEMEEDLEDMKDNDDFDYSWVSSGSKCELSYVDEELSEEYDCEMKTRMIIIRDDEYILALNISGDNDKDDIDDLYKDFLSELKN